MQTKTWCLTLDLKDDEKLIAEYEYYHRDDVIWQEIIEGNKAVGILSMDIYRVSTRLVMIMETTLEFEVNSGFSKLSLLPRQKEWAELMAKYQATPPFARAGEHWVEMHKIFTQR